MTFNDWLEQQNKKLQNLLEKNPGLRQAIESAYDSYGLSKSENLTFKSGHSYKFTIPKEALSPKQVAPNPVLSVQRVNISEHSLKAGPTKTNEYLFNINNKMELTVLYKLAHEKNVQELILNMQPSPAPTPRPDSPYRG